jgi:hypothetical protein
MQGHSNEDNPRETMWLFQKQSGMFFQINWGMPFQLMQMQNVKNSDWLSHFPPAN